MDLYALALTHISTRDKRIGIEPFRIASAPEAVGVNAKKIQKIQVKNGTESIEIDRKSS